MDWAAVLAVVQLLIAGFCGGLLRSVYFSETRVGYFRNCIVGTITAYYLGPMAPRIFSPWFPDGQFTEFRELAGFLVGCGGVALIGWISDYAESRRAEKGP